MVYYYIILIFLSLASVFPRGRVNRLILFFPIVMIWLVSAFNGGMGTDYDDYFLIWQRSPTLYEVFFANGSLLYEPAFGFLVSFIKSVGLGFPFFYLILYSISLVILLTGFKEVVPNIGIAILGFFCIFFFVGYVNLPRQGMVLVALPLIVHFLAIGAQVKLYLLLLSLVLFHYSAILLFPAILLSKLIKSRSRLRILVLIGVALLLLLKIVPLLPFLLYVESFLPFEKITFYVESLNHYQTPNLIMLIKDLKVVSIGLLGFYILYRDRSGSPIILKSVMIYWIGLFLYFLFGSLSHLMASRVFLIFEVSSLIYVSYLFAPNFRRSHLDFILAGCVLAYYFLMFGYLLFYRYNDVFGTPIFFWE